MADGFGSAFGKGGCGCLALFAIGALFTLMFGGNAHADPGGVVLLFVIGGIIGIGIQAIYNKGKKDSAKKEDDRTFHP